MDYKYYAVSFARELQKLEHSNSNININIDTIELIRRFKIQLGISVPETLSEGTEILISEGRKY